MTELSIAFVTLFSFFSLITLVIPITNIVIRYLEKKGKI